MDNSILLFLIHCFRIPNLMNKKFTITIFIFTLLICSISASFAKVNGVENNSTTTTILYDFGDAPTSYGKPMHLYKQTPNLMLGAFVDYDTNVSNNSNATADDKSGSVNDEDGVPVFPLLYASNTSYSIHANVTNTTGENAYLYGFIDFNGDGDFSDAGETSDITTVENGATSVAVNWNGLSGQLKFGATFARFRIAASATEVQYASGYAASGEVEDYPIIIMSSVLPIEFISFKPKFKNDNSVVLTWKTASEYNNDYFEVQRSVDTETWESIGCVKGNGNSHWVSTYTFTDDHPYPGFSYYKLKQMDFDHKFRYSIIASVKTDTNQIETKENITVYANPANNELWVKIDNKTKDSDMQIYNFSGQNILNSSISKSEQSIDLKEYPEGMYIVIVEDKLFKIIKE